MNDDNRGLYGKYNVTKVETGKPADTVIFCLDRRDPNALAALLEYAKGTRNHMLRRDLFVAVDCILCNPELCAEIKWEKSELGFAELLALLNQNRWMI